MTEESLTEEKGFDILEHAAELEAAALEAEPGEEVEDEVNESPDPEPEEEDEEGPEEDSVEEDEESEDDLESDEPTAEEQEESETEVEDEELSEVALLREQNQKLLELLSAQQQPKVAPPPVSAPAKPDLDPKLLESALFGTNPELWEKVPADKKSRYKSFVEDYVKQETQYALHPEKRYEQFEELVQRTVADMVGPVLKQHYQTETQTVIQSTAGDLWNDPKAKQRIIEAYKANPLSQQNNVELQKGAFKLAVEKIKLEREKEELSDLRAERAARTKQEKARKPGRRKSKRGSHAAGSKKRPVRLSSGDDLLDFYHRRLKESEGS